jgi:hypothetical protein
MDNNEQTEVAATALNVGEPLDAWGALHELDRVAWLRRATAATDALHGYFSPQKALNLEYIDAYHGKLTLLGEDGSRIDCGRRGHYPN